MSAAVRRSAWLRKLLRAFALGGVLLSVLTVRVVSASRGELARADQLRGQERLDAAIVAYRRAARWYAPGNPYGVAALRALIEIGQQSEEEEPARALSAYRSARSAILSARSFYTPHSELLPGIDDKIATLMAAQPPPPIDATQDEAERRQAYLALLSRPAGATFGWSLLALLGFFAWVFGAFLFSSRAIDREDQLIPAAARLWGSVVIVGFGLFVLGLALA